MSKFYNISFEPLVDNIHLLKVGFGEEQTDNRSLVQDVESQIMGMLKKGTITGGNILCIDGAATLPIISVLTHRTCHLYGAIAVFDPKLMGYVVTVSHTGAYKVGDLIVKTNLFNY